MSFSSAYFYIVIGMVIEVINAILISYMDENDMWSTAMMLGLGGFLFPFFFALPMALPNFMFTWKEILLLAPYSVGKSILLTAWIWSIYAVSAGEVETLRLKIRALNSIIGAMLGAGFMPFIISDFIMFSLVLILMLILGMVAVNNIKAYRSRRKLRELIIEVLREEGVIRVDELVVKLKIPDYIVRDLVFELCAQDLVDVMEARGIYVYLRSPKP